MRTRTNALTHIRPTLSNIAINTFTSREEHFQNTVLRPLIQLQNDLIIEVFKNYITKHKNIFYGLSLPQQLNFFENVLQKDMKFRNSVKGMIIGLFTVEEYVEYIDHSSALNKRMMSLIKERLISQIQLFEPEVATLI